jgi:hypothetical protein
MPEFLTCHRRQPVERLEKGGSKREFQQCANMIAKRFGTEVAAEDCGACPVRAGARIMGLQLEGASGNRDWDEPTLEADGTIRYARRGIEPPPEHEGYRRLNEDVTSDDAWAFVPVFLPCPFREMVNGVRRSGCLKTNAVCVHEDSGYQNQVVTPEICAACEVRPRDHSAACSDKAQPQLEHRT